MADSNTPGSFYSKNPSVTQLELGRDIVKAATEAKEIAVDAAADAEQAITTVNNALTDINAAKAEALAAAEEATAAMDSIETTLESKADVVHTHTKSQITDFAHQHPTSDITGLDNALAGKASLNHTHTKTDISDFAHTHPQSEISGLTTALAGKAAASHTHAQSDITGLTTALSGKQETSQKGQINGYASLDGNGKVPASQLPTIATAANQITFTPTGGIAASNVQTALAELDSEKAALNHTHTLDGLSDVDTTGAVLGSVLKYNGSVWVVGSDIVGDGGGSGGGGATTASELAFVPAGNIAAINVQSAIVELDNEKAPVAHTHTKADITDFAHGHTKADITDFAHTHAASDITGLDEAMSGKADLAGATFTGKVTFAASTTANAGLNIGVGSAPGTAVDGDLWIASNTLIVRVNGNSRRLSAINSENTWQNRQTFMAADGSKASMTIPHGTAPATPVNGDVWTTTDGMYVRINGTTVGPLGSTATASSTTFTPTGNLAATDVQNALAELDLEKAPVSHTHTMSALTDLDSWYSTYVSTPLAGKAASSHTHALGDLPVAASGTSDSTKLVRADDSRLSNARTPTAHAHPTSEITGLDTALAGKQGTAERGVANGYAALDATAKVPMNQLPIGAMAQRNVTISTALPSGGADGDFWAVVT